MRVSGARLFALAFRLGTESAEKVVLEEAPKDPKAELDLDALVGKIVRVEMERAAHGDSWIPNETGSQSIVCCSRICAFPHDSE